MFKWQPTKQQKAEYYNFIKECERVHALFGVSFSRKYESAYFQKDGVDYRISQHDIPYDSYYHDDLIGSSYSGENEKNIVVRGKYAMLSKVKEILEID